jgi:hypothetical protein
VGVPDAAHTGLGVAQAVEEERPVRQVGDRVVEGLVGQPLLEPGVGQSGGGHRGDGLEHEPILFVEGGGLGRRRFDVGRLVERDPEPAGCDRSGRVEQLDRPGRQELVGGPDELAAHVLRIGLGPDGRAGFVEPLHLLPFPVLAEGPPVGELQHGDGNDGGDEHPGLEFDGGGDEDAEGQSAPPGGDPHAEPVPERVDDRGALRQGDDAGHGQHREQRVDQHAGHGGQGGTAGEVAGAGTERGGDGEAEGRGGGRLTAVEGRAHPTPPVPEVPGQGRQPDAEGRFGR